MTMLSIRHDEWAVYDCLKNKLHFESQCYVFVDENRKYFDIVDLDN